MVIWDFGRFLTREKTESTTLSALTRMVLLLSFMNVNVFSQGMTAHIKACGLLAHCYFCELVEQAGPGRG
ncbi:MAG: hypothetical protein H8E78_09585 [Proteobacteria bacterium]|nr:hypothetical protein [Pseudomonadota bacterium]